MSIKLVSLVLGGLEVQGDDHVSAERVRLVLAKLADHANDVDNVCWPSLARVARDLHLPLSSVRYAVVALMAQDLIKTVGDRSKGGRTTQWRLTLPRAPATPLAGQHATGVVGQQNSQPATHDSQPATHETSTRHTLGDESSMNHQRTALNVVETKNTTTTTAEDKALLEASAKQARKLRQMLRTTVKVVQPLQEVS